MTDASSDILSAQAPLISLATARNILVAGFGIDGVCSELPSERDRNVRVQSSGSAFVLKVSNSAEDESVVDMENAAMAHIAGVDPSLPIPRLVPTTSGMTTTTVTGDDGRQHLARVVSVVPGSPVEGSEVEPRLAYEIGAATARTALAMQGFFHRAAGRTHAWDIRAARELRPLVRHVDGAARKASIAHTLDAVGPSLDRVPSLPAQVAHADVTLTNVLVDEHRRLTGVIDFGDMHHTAVVCDLAVSLNSVVRSVAHRGWDAVALLASHFLEGYQRHRPLTHGEGDVLADLLRARLVVSIVVSAWRVGEHPGNTDYIAQYDEGSWALLDVLEAHPESGPAFARFAGTGRGFARGTPDSTLRGRRDAVFGGTLSPLMYAEPLQLARGEGAWLVTTDGRRYLDAYNNVPVVGHANAVVNQAVGQQSRQLNTNARYLHDNAVTLGERILATMPDSLGLDTCILVNSGSEAVDLAWRFATAFTEATGAIVGDNAYHGITTATEAFSSNEWPADHHPAYVATFESPYAAADGAAPGAAEAASRADDAHRWLALRGHRPALLLVDPLFTSAGILDADPAFLRALGATAQRHGALVLADEVQSGFGRTGPALWAFAESGLAPDIVTLGKPMGNGHPVAAVVTRREIASAMASTHQYFSTFAGSPVSAAAALATLDVLEDRRLPAQALATGDYLREGLRRLAHESGLLGAVRGRGLLAGVDVLPDGPVTASQSAESLREHGVLVGVTGRRRDVLKIRPPLVWDSTHVDVLIAALRRVLTDASRPPG